jgi:hypothetical protein
MSLASELFHDHCKSKIPKPKYPQGRGMKQSHTSDKFQFLIKAEMFSMLQSEWTILSKVAVSAVHHRETTT